MRLWLVLMCAMAVTGELRAASPTTLLIEVVSMDDAAWKRLGLLELQKRVVLRAIEEGFAVVGRGQEPQMSARVFGSDTGIVLTVVSTKGERTAQVAYHDEPIESFHLATMHRLLEMLRELRPEVAAEPFVMPGGPVSEPVRDITIDRAPEPRRESWQPRPRLGAGVGVALRGDASPLLRLDFKVDLPLRWLAAGIEVLGTGSSAEDSSIREGATLAGLYARLPTPPGNTLHAELGLSAGAWHHTYRFEDESRHYKADLAAAASLTFSFPLSRTVALVPRAQLLMTPRRREHTIDADVAWTSSRARGLFDASVVVCF